MRREKGREIKSARDKSEREAERKSFFSPSDFKLVFLSESSLGSDSELRDL